MRRDNRRPRRLAVEVREDPAAPPSQLVEALAALVLARALAAGREGTRDGAVDRRKGVKRKPKIGP
jgi:hypothetical protein